MWFWSLVILGIVIIILYKPVKRKMKINELFSAAEQGDSDAQYKLGKCFYDGIGMNEDRVEAVKWYYKAAEQGDPDAMYWLSHCYEEGIGVEKDDDNAKKWKSKADRGYTKIYGAGMERNKSKALHRTVGDPLE